MILPVVFLFAVAVAFANGANDVSKGIATLVGSGVTSPRRAVLWGVLWTGVGGVTAAFLAHAMLQTFGAGLLAPGVHPVMAAALATIAGATLWVAIASRLGLPVSTTHAIVGSVAGVGTIAYGLHGVNWPVFGGKIVLPLLLSPAVALVLTTLLIRTARSLVPNAEIDCVCIETAQPELAAEGGMALPVVGAPQVNLASCVAGQRPSAAGVTLNHLHWLTSGATSFARALNDTPKMAALALGAAAITGAAWPPLAFFFAITSGMVAGSFLAGFRVTDVLAQKVTRMDHREGFLANLVTAALVGPGAALGLPMSTTHVASGAIMGVAAGNSSGVNRKTVRDMLAAWVVTLPAAALLGVGVLLAIRIAGLR